MIDRVTGQSITCRRETGYTLALKDLKTHANDPWKNNVRANSVGGAQGQNPRQSLIRKFENDKHDQPDAEDAQSQDQQAPQQACQQSHDRSVGSCPGCPHGSMELMLSCCVNVRSSQS